MKNKQIKRAIDTSLSSLRITERDVQSIMTQVREGKQVKKKLSVGVIVALLLIMLTVTAVGVGLMTGIKYWEAKDGEIGSPQDMAVLDGKVYLTTEDGFFEWDPETEETRELDGIGVEAIWSSLFVRDGELMLLAKQGKLWRFEDGGWTLERDYAGTPLAEFAGKMSHLAYWQNCILAPQYLENGGSQNLLKLDLTDGSVEVLYEGNVLRLCDYRDDQMLAVLIIDDETEQLAVMDKTTGSIIEELTRTHLLAIKGLAYDAVHDRIYAMIDGTLSLWNGREWQAIRQATLPWLAHSFAVVGDRYLAVSHEGIQSIRLDVKQPEDQIALSICGINAFNSDLDHDFQQSHANVSVVRRAEMSWNAWEVEQAIRGGDETDLFLFPVDATWPDLLESGLLEPVRSEKLMDHSADMAELFRELVYEDEELYAVIMDATVLAWSQNTSPAPATLEELMAEKHAALTWDYQLWKQTDYIDHLIRQQIRESGTNFNTPAFRQTLETMKQNGLDKRSQPLLSTARAYSMGNLFETKGYAAPLRIDGGKPEHYPIELYLYVLNPNSRHKETAIEYLEYTVSQMGAETRAMLCPEQAEPALLPFAEEWMERVKVEHAQDVKDGILPDDPAALEERLENLRDMSGHQLVTQEQLDFYKQTVFPNLDLKMHPLLSYQNREAIARMQEIVGQYLQSERSLDETIQMLTEIAEKAVP